MMLMDDYFINKKFEGIIYMDLINLEKEMKNYKAEMTSSERLDLYLQGDRVDHLPYEIFCTDWIIAGSMGYSLKDLSDIDIYSKVIKKRSDDYRITGFSEPFVLRNVGEAVGSKIFYPENEIDYIEKFLMEEDLDMGLIEAFDPYTNFISKQKLDRARKLKDRFKDQPISTEVSGPITVAAAIRPINKLLRDLRKNPEDVKRLLDFCVDVNMKWLEAFINEFGLCGISIADPVACDDILSPSQIKEFVYPYLDELVTRIYQLTGNKPALHVCGHTNKQWGSYNNLDIGLYSLDNCEDLEQAKIAMQDNVIIEGNVPPVEVMRYGSINEVIDSVKDCIKKGADSRKGFICATGCDTPIGTPKENLDAFIYAMNKFSKDARIGQIPDSFYKK